MLTQIPQKERINSRFSASEIPHFQMFSVLLPIISMISLQYSIPLSGSLALALSISGGDIMNIIQVGCSVAGRGGYGG